MKIARAAVDQLLDVLGNVGPGGPLGRKIADLLLRRDLARQEKPEEAYRLAGGSSPKRWVVRLTFGQRLLAAGSFREQFLALGDSLATESNALLCVENRALPDEGLDAAGTTINLVERHLADHLGAMLSVGGHMSMPARGGREGVAQERS